MSYVSVLTRAEVMLNTLVPGTLKTVDRQDKYGLRIPANVQPIVLLGAPKGQSERFLTGEINGIRFRTWTLRCYMWATWSTSAKPDTTADEWLNMIEAVEQVFRRSPRMNSLADVPGVSEVNLVQPEAAHEDTGPYMTAGSGSHTRWTSIPIKVTEYMYS